MEKLSNILVYHWQGWKGFLISHIVTDYCQYEAGYEDDIGTLNNALTPNIKAVLLQINLSKSKYFPKHRAELIQAMRDRGLIVLNKAIDDITKSYLHQILENAGIPNLKAGVNGKADEYLFVKTNLNWGGEVEQRLFTELKQQFVDSVVARPIERHDQYYIVRREDLMAEIWQDKSIVIERYVSNAENSFYRIYTFGDAVVVVKAYSYELIKKISGNSNDQNYCYDREDIVSGKTALPEKLQQTIRQFLVNVELDYFCLDIVHDMENFFVIDLNLTPYSGVQSQTSDVVNFLRQGAHQYVKRLKSQ